MDPLRGERAVCNRWVRIETSVAKGFTLSVDEPNGVQLSARVMLRTAGNDSDTGKLQHVKHLLFLMEHRLFQGWMFTARTHWEARFHNLT